MILVWFNPNKEVYYTRFYNYYILNNYYVGYVNSYNHIVIQMFYLFNDKVYNVVNYNDYIRQKDSQKKNNSLLTFFKMLIYKYKNI